MTPWNAYLAATARLDEVRRAAESDAEAARAAATAAASELAGVRTRIILQRGRLADVASLTGEPAPVTDPQPAEREAAAAAIAQLAGDPTPALTAAVKGIRATLDAADATLSVVATGGGSSVPLGGWPPAARHGLVYGWHALLALVAVIEISVIAGNAPQAQLIVALLALGIPAGAWLLGWITVRVLFGIPGGRRSLPVRGTPGARRNTGGHGALLGAAICAVPMLVGMFLSVV